MDVMLSLPVILLIAGLSVSCCSYIVIDPSCRLEKEEKRLLQAMACFWAVSIPVVTLESCELD